MENTQKFDDALLEKWFNLYETQSEVLFKTNLETIEMKKIGKYLAYYNQTLDLDEEEVPSVFKNFDENAYNFNTVNEKEILFYVDLDEEEIAENDNDDDENLEADISESRHPILINNTPICPRASILPLFPKEELPQVIGQDLLILLFSLFNISKSKAFRVGYNSIGAGSIANHLHFELIYVDDLLPKEGKLPIEIAETELFLRNNLQSPAEEINMYSCGVEIQTLKNYPFKGFLIKPWSSTGAQPDQSEIFASLAFVCGTLTNVLLDFSLAHNLIFSDAGQTIYIIPRIHSSYLKKKSSFSQGWLMVGGIIVCEERNEFDGLNEEFWEKWGREKIAVEEDIFNNLCAKIKEMFESKFKK